MPELPEVETIVRELGPQLQGKYIEGMVIRPKFTQHMLQDISSRDLYTKIIGQSISCVDRKGKYIIILLENHHSLIIHLGMTGKLLVKPSDDLTFEDKIAAGDFVDKHTHFVMEIVNPWGTGGDVEVHFNDVRMFGKVWLDEFPGEPLKILSSLGWDALLISLKDFEKILERKRTIKSLLLDQHLIAGIGNIYADEILFSASIHPATQANQLSKTQGARLWFSVKSVLKEGIRFKGSSISDYQTTDGTRGSFQDYHRVYQRSGLECSRCDSIIQKIKIAGRSTHFCPKCQAEGGDVW